VDAPRLRSVESNGAWVTPFPAQRNLYELLWLSGRRPPNWQQRQRVSATLSKKKNTGGVLADQLLQLPLASCGSWAGKPPPPSHWRSPEFTTRTGGQSGNTGKDFPQLSPIIHSAEVAPSYFTLDNPSAGDYGLKQFQTDISG
jgi:hypothetical protein